MNAETESSDIDWEYLSKKYNNLCLTNLLTSWDKKYSDEAKRAKASRKWTPEI